MGSHYGTASKAADSGSRLCHSTDLPTATRRGIPRKRVTLNGGTGGPHRRSGTVDTGVDEFYVQQIGAGQEEFFAAQREGAYDRRPEVTRRRAAELLHLPYVATSGSRGDCNTT